MEKPYEFKQRVGTVPLCHSLEENVFVPIDLLSLGTPSSLRATGKLDATPCDLL